MLNGLGKYHNLEVIRESPHGFYLKLGDSEVLLPNKYCDGLKPGSEVNVFIYKDSEDRPVATTEKPLATLGEYALMEVVGEAPFGVFVDMGLEKHLLVPKSEIGQEMEQGKKYLIRVMMDFKTERLIGVAKIEGYSELPEELEIDDQLEGWVYQKTDLGFKIWTEQSFIGLVYHNQIFTPIAVNDKVTCFVDNIREDGKVDLRIKKGGLDSISGDAQIILAYLKEHDGSMDITDKSSPEKIQQIFGLSKKAFKRAIGLLYKDKIIGLFENSIVLNEPN